MTKDTEGSLWIKKVLLDDRPSPVYIQTWGGTNTTAAALRSIEQEFKGTPQWDAIYRKVSDKAVIYIILDHDPTYKNYIAKNWPDVRVIYNAGQFEGGFAYTWAGAVPQADRFYFEKNWIAENIRQGPIGSTYPLYGEPSSICRPSPTLCVEGDWFSEGDSPSFLHEIGTGLRNLENPAWGGWGGRFAQVGPRLWTDDPSKLSKPGRVVRDAFASQISRPRLTLPTAAGATKVRINTTGGFLFAGDALTFGSGADAETRTVASIGTQPAQSANRLIVPAAPGDSNIKVSSVAGLVVGQPVLIGTGSAREMPTVTAIGTAARSAITLVDSPAGATNLKVTSTAGMAVGNVLAIGTGTSRETFTITAVGTSGASGTGIDITPALTRPVPFLTSVVNVSNPGTGVTVSPPLQSGHAVDTFVGGVGTEITLSAPLERAYPADAQASNGMDPYFPQTRWAEAIQNDMAARIGWTTKGRDDSNHPPAPQVAAANMVVAAGQRVTLHSTVTDPDGDAVNVRWWQYAEAGTYGGSVAIADATTTAPSVTVPADAKPGETIHVIQEAKDSGTPTLTRYQRVVITVATPVPGEVGGTVPATLSLSLGAPAAFAPFTPGVQRDYEATTTASVVSSAGDARLTVADPSSVATGRLVNGQYSLPEALEAQGSRAGGAGSAFAAVGGAGAPTTLVTYGAR